MERYDNAIITGFIWALAAVFVGSVALAVVGEIDNEVKCKLDIVREK